MIKNTYGGLERRKFVRLDYIAPLNYKICNEQTLSNLLQGYTINISQAGLLCKIKDKVKKNDILWFAFDRGFLSFCEELEKRSFIYQNGIIAKVARIESKSDGNYEIGVNFIVREEKNLTNIYPKIHFEENDNLEGS
ncbi:MAG: PilZ domain-containing protein [Candidatus Omnitrophota bacterium]